MRRISRSLRASVLLGAGALFAGHAAASAHVARTAGAVRANGSAPTVSTGVADRSGMGFKLHGSVNPGGLSTRYYFIYKPVGSVECEDLEGCGPATATRKLTGSATHEVRSPTSGHLQRATEYEYWLVARNADGTAVGQRLTFTVAAK